MTAYTFNNLNANLFANPFANPFCISYSSPVSNPFGNIFGSMPGACWSDPMLNNPFFNNPPLFNFGFTPTFQMPNFSFPDIFGFLNDNNYSKPRHFNTKTTLKEYNAKKAEKLADAISKIRTGFDGKCAAHVKEAIADAGLGEYESGHAYQLADILSDNKNFKEISTDGVDLAELQAGCVLVYDKGVAGYDSQYGHTEITLGDGTASSGGITSNIRDGARVFIPV